MPCWYYEMKELRNTPSIQDGLDYETERRYRKEGARLISDIGAKMELGYNTVATGVVYFHRFYMFQTFKNFARYVTACCCLFLAGKVEETPKKCNDIIATARMLIGEEEFRTFGKNPKNEVMILERILLQTIKFDLEVEHPYRYLLEFAKTFKGNKKKLQHVVQMAWAFANDSLATTLSLQWEAEVIAVALIHLATRLSKFKIEDWEGRQPHHSRWWDMFVEDITKELLEDICHQVLDCYSSTDNTLKLELEAISSDPNEPRINKSPTQPLALSPLDRPAPNVPNATTVTTPVNGISPAYIPSGLPMEPPNHYPPYTTPFTYANPSALPPVTAAEPAPFFNYVDPPPHMNVGVPPPHMNVGVLPPHMNVGVPPPHMNVGVPPPYMNVGVPPPHMNVGVPPPHMNVGVPPPMHQPYYSPNGHFYPGGSSAPMPDVRPYYYP